MKIYLLIFICLSSLLLQIYISSEQFFRDDKYKQAASNLPENLTANVLENISDDNHLPVVSPPNTKLSNNNQQIAELKNIVIQLDAKVKHLVEQVEHLSAQAGQSKQKKIATIAEDPVAAQQKEQERKFAVGQIELILHQAIGIGEWTAKDSEQMIEYVMLLNTQDRLYLNKIFRDAQQNGLTSLRDYPPPI
ncbi:hypothetical protein [Aliikangiella maris]|uniref:Secreted protein n=2 Tax=Aliikangiella maris TaxID=3162458 RepID=A0ABV2BNP6_9GAMM